MWLWCEIWKQGLLVCYKTIRERKGEERRQKKKRESERSSLIAVSFLNKQSPLPDPNADAK